MDKREERREGKDIIILIGAASKEGFTGHLVMKTTDAIISQTEKGKRRIKNEKIKGNQ